MRDSVPSVRYSSVCNVLRQWRIWLTLLIESTDSMIKHNALPRERFDKHNIQQNE